MNLPDDIAQQALDAAGVEYTLGSMEDGTRPAQVLLRAYGQCLRQLLRAAPWDFCRRDVPLVLLADASGQTPDVGTVVPSGFIYEYRYPNDCARVRYIPWSPFQNPGIPPGNIQVPATPIVTGLSSPPYLTQPIRPARFLLTNDPNYPSAPGQVFWESQGSSPQGSVVILTNVQNARCIYTFQAIYPSIWDAMFRAAFVAYLASEVALPLAKDKKFGMAIQDRQIGIVKQKLSEARAADGQEGWHSSDIGVDWMNFRNAGGLGYGGAGFGGGYNDMGGLGCWGGGWGNSLAFGNGSAY